MTDPNAGHLSEVMKEIEAAGLWHIRGLPLGMPWVTLPDEGQVGVTTFVRLARMLERKVVYGQERPPWATGGGADAVVAFACDGVLHVLELGGSLQGSDSELGRLRWWQLADAVQVDPTDPPEELLGDDLLEESLGDDLPGGPYQRQLTSADLDELLGWCSVPKRLRTLAIELGQSPQYNGSRDPRSREAIEAFTTELPQDDRQHVEEGADMVYSRVVERSLHVAAKRLAAEILEQDWFNPLLELEPQVNERMEVADWRLLYYVRRVIHQMPLWEELADERYKEALGLALRVLELMPPIERDRLGFVRGDYRKAALASEYAGQLIESEALREYVLGMVGGAERRFFEDLRCQRYATAGRALRAAGISKSRSAEVLRLSAPVLNRLIAAYPDDVVIAHEDPIRQTLIPEFPLA